MWSKGLAHQMNSQNNSDSSICRAICEKESRIELHRRTIVLNVGLSRPRSTKLIVVRSKPASKASFSCDNPIFFRLDRRISPKALSGPDRG
jgi:hypothetical protein